MVSTNIWLFSCILGLVQDRCGKYQVDEAARGYGRFDGCPSCTYRYPRNSATEAAEYRHTSQKEKEE